MSDALARCDSAAHDVVQAYGLLGVLTVTVRRDGDQCRLICPAGYEADLARLLYMAADTMADHAPREHRLKYE